MSSGRWVAAALCVHILIVSVRVPVWPDEPIREGDWPIKFTEAYQVARDFPRTGRTWTYSTTHLAGYPAGVYTGVGVQYYSLAVTALGPYLGAARAFRVSLWGLLAFAPLLSYWTGRVYGFPVRICLFILVTSLAVWHLESHVRYMWDFGTTAFLTGATVVGFAGACLLRFSERPTCLLAIGAGSALSLAATLHPLHAITAAGIVAVPVWVGLRGRFRIAFLIGCFAILTAVLAVNWHWLVPFLTLSREAFDGGTESAFASGWKHLVFDLIADRSYRRPFDGTVGMQLIFALTGLALVARPAEFGHPLRCQILIALGVVLGFGYFGGYVPGGAGLQPYRFTAAAVLLAVPFVPWGMRGLEYPSSVGGRRTIVLLSYLVAVRLTPEVIQILSTRPMAPLVASERRLCEWLRDNTDQSGRVLVGQSLIAFANITPFHLQRDFIGTPYEDVVSAHRYSNFDKKWFGRPVMEMTDAEFLERIDLLNIRWAMFERSDFGRERIERLTSEFRKRAEFETVTIYERTAAPNYFHAGPGRVERDNGDLVLNDLSAGPVVLKFHYLSTLRADPPVSLRRVRLLGDPVGFIAFDNPGHRTIRIYNSYGKSPPP